MKKIIYLLAALLVTFTSCESFIEPNNKSNEPADEFYRTKTGFESLVNATYSSMRAIYGNEPFLFCAGVDIYASGRNTLPDIGKYLALTPQDSHVKNFYSRCYSGIQLANGVIYYSDLTEQTPTIEARVAEARFIRAFYYFLLVEQFGGVPLVKDYIQTAQFEYPRSSEEEVYNFIISEMENLKAPLAADRGKDGTGRITQRTVNHLLAKVYLSRGWALNSQADFNKSAEYAELAINGEGLTLEFEEVYSPNNETNSEVLWAVQYNNTQSMEDTSNDGNMQQAYFSTYLNGSEAGHKSTTSTLTPTLRLHELFTEGDSRYYGTFMVCLYESYYDYYTGGNSEVLFYYPPAWDVKDTAEWRAADYEKRKNTVIIPMQEKTFTTTGKESTYEDQATGDVYGVSCIKKFDDPKSPFSTRSSSRDVVLARLSETYLIAAEAYLKAGNMAKAVEKINIVRNRAAMDGYDLSVTNIDIDFILDERARELAGEYLRWMDLKRTNKIVDYCLKYNPEISSENVFGTNQGKAKYRPIPQDAIDLNHSEVAQNPGY